MAYSPQSSSRLTADRFVRPSHVQGLELHGFVWSLELRCEVPVRATLPKWLDPAEAIAAAERGHLVLDRSMRHLKRAQLS